HHWPHTLRVTGLSARKRTHTHTHTPSCTDYLYSVLSPLAVSHTHFKVFDLFFLSVILHLLPIELLHNNTTPSHHLLYYPSHNNHHTISPFTVLSHNNHHTISPFTVLSI